MSATPGIPRRYRRDIQALWSQRKSTRRRHGKKKGSLRTTSRGGRRQNRTAWESIATDPRGQTLGLFLERDEETRDAISKFRSIKGAVEHTKTC